MLATCYHDIPLRTSLSSLHSISPPPVWLFSLLCCSRQSALLHLGILSITALTPAKFKLLNDDVSTADLRSSSELTSSFWRQWVTACGFSGSSPHLGSCGCSCRSMFLPILASSTDVIQLVVLAVVAPLRPLDCRSLIDWRNWSQIHLGIFTCVHCHAVVRGLDPTLCRRARPTRNKIKFWADGFCDTYFTDYISDVQTSARLK